MLGRKVSRYRIVEKLGGGGMGVVYRAVDMKLDRAVALKFLPREFANEETAKRRFINEAKSASALDHPNIAVIHDIGETKQGQLFIAMACYEGETLRRIISRGPLSVRSAINYALQICAALEQAHSHGIVHRDVKPSNIFVTEEDVVKLLDFGIAKIADVQITKTGETVGTASYMSPEQTFGDSVDERTDIWALGVILYEMLTGERPFEAAWTEAVLYRIRHDDPTPIHSHRSDVPPALEGVVERLIAKRPQDRCRHTRNVADDLKAVRRKLDDDSVLSTTTSADSTSDVAAIQTVAVLPFSNLSDLSGQEYFVEGMTGAITDELARTGVLKKVIWHGSAVQYKDTDKSISLTSDELGVDAVVTGSVLREENDVRIRVRLIDGRSEQVVWANRYEGDLRGVFALQAEVGEAVAKEIERTLAADLRDDATAAAGSSAVFRPDPSSYEAYLKGQYFAARWRPDEQSVRRAIQYYLDSVNKDPRFARGHAGLALAHLRTAWFDLNNLALGKAAALEAIQLDARIPEGHAALGFARMLEWDWSGAETSFQRAIELNPHSADAHQWYAQLLRAAMRLDEAIEVANRALELNPLSITARIMVGWVYFNQKRYMEALEIFDEVLGLDPKNSLAIYNKGLVYANFGRDEQLLAMASDAEAAGLSEIFATFLFALGHSSAKAAEKAERSLEALKTHSESDPTRSAAAMVAAVYVRQGELEHAFDWIEKGIEVRSPILPSATSEPFFDDVRSHPRFRELRAQMGLPFESQRLKDGPSV